VTQPHTRWSSSSGSHSPLLYTLCLRDAHVAQRVHREGNARARSFLRQRVRASAAAVLQDDRLAVSEEMHAGSWSQAGDLVGEGRGR
jgi:hypothetical protein